VLAAEVAADIGLLTDLAALAALSVASASVPGAVVHPGHLPKNVVDTQLRCTANYITVRMANRRKPRESGKLRLMQRKKKFLDLLKFYCGTFWMSNLQRPWHGLFTTQCVWGEVTPKIVVMMGRVAGYHRLPIGAEKDSVVRLRPTEISRKGQGWGSIGARLLAPPGSQMCPLQTCSSVSLQSAHLGR
jgi:hypothetical protein